MTQPAPPPTTDLHLRVYTEFSEMPGLRLTLDQACRLCSLESETCLGVLQALVDAAVLRKVGPYYMRADLGDFCA